MQVLASLAAIVGRSIDVGDASLSVSVRGGAAADAVRGAECCESQCRSRPQKQRGEAQQQRRWREGCWEEQRFPHARGAVERRLVRPSTRQEDDDFHLGLAAVEPLEEATAGCRLR